MTDIEREELVDEVLLRISEMDDIDKKKRQIINRKIMSGVTDHFDQLLKDYNARHPYDSFGEHVRGPSIWHAYYEIRKLIPWFITVRYGNIDNWNEFYRNNPNAKRREMHDTIPNQMLEEDRDLATAIGCELINMLFRYLEPSGWNEFIHRKSKR